MCITFIYNGCVDQQSDYSLVIASNRDEYYDRASQNMCSWREFPHIYGGIDLEAECQGTWLAYSRGQNKIGILLNLPGANKENANSRGQIVADYLKTNQTLQSYIQNMYSYIQNCNEFIFVTVEFSGNKPIIHSYSNATNKLETWEEECVGFSNSLPDEPLKKVDAGKIILQDLCKKYNKIKDKSILIEKITELLKSKEKHLPDPVLQQRRPENFEWFSSIYVSIPPVRYGTRCMSTHPVTHTLLLVTKAGHVDLIEFTLQSPIDVTNLEWKKTHIEFDCHLKTNL